MLTLYSALAFTACTLSAQEAAKTGTNSAPADTSPSDDTVMVLDPFSVSTESEGYKAVDTLGGARVRTKLADTPSSLSVVTSKLLQDLAATNAQDLLVYTNNTEVAGFGGNFSGVTSRGAGIAISGAAEGSRLINPAGVNRSRGLTALDNTRNFFVTDIPWDGFNVSRLDISRGPNSFLFGVGSPSGISNVSMNEATFTEKGTIELRAGSFGSVRQTLDYNKVLIPSELALRVDLLNDSTEYQQKPAFNHSKRAYGALRFDPKFLKTDSSYMKIQANIEHGDVKSNNPRDIPPLDYVTGYLKDPNASSTGYNPWTYTQNDGGTDPKASSWTGHGSIGNIYQWGNNANYTWNGATGALLGAGQSGWTSPTSANYGAADAKLNNQYHVHSIGDSDHAKAVNYADPTQYKGAYAGTVTYYDKTLSDPSVFDFYHKLIDGNNKREWQKWNTFSVTAQESLFNERLVIQGVADHQDYRYGSEGLMNSRSPVIMLDLDSYLLTYPSWLSQGQANPNVGRPVVFGDYGQGKEQRSLRNNYQVTAAGEIRPEDIGAKGLLASVVGKQEFTGLGGRYTQTQWENDYKIYGLDSAWAKAFNGGTKLADNGITWDAYLGKSMLGTSGTGANLSNLAENINPTTYPLSSYYKVWTAAATVIPTAAWDVTTADGVVRHLTQADNPANYAGYTGVPVTVLNANANMDQLRTGSNMSKQTITSQAFMYQGHFWDDTIIPSFGWRKDKTKQSGNNAVADSVSGLFQQIDEISDPGIETTTTSKSWGVAVHLPKMIKKNLPEGTDVSLYYFHGANETPKVRYAIDGSQLANETGKTDDYSIQFDGFKGKLTVRLTYFKTIDENAQASYGQPLGTNSYMIDSLPAWTVTFAAAALAVEEYGADNVPADLKGNGWLWQWAVDHPTVAKSIANELKTTFADAFPQSFWDQYGSNVDINAVKAGDWLHVLKNQPVPYTWLATANHSIHGQTAIIDQNLESKGWELEATFRPLKNWDITFNGSKATAQQTSLGASASRYLNSLAGIWLGTDIGKVANWGSYTDYGAMKQSFMQNLWAPYLQQVALTGADQPEWRKLKFNVISTYRFDRGWAKGLRVGGAFRWQDKAILGYGIHQADVYGEQAWISDVNQPLYGPTDEHFDAWIGYEHALTSKIRWDLQLNVRNVGEKVGLVPITLDPDGTVAQSRIQNGQNYQLTLKFSF